MLMFLSDIVMNLWVDGYANEPSEGNLFWLMELPMCVA